jgi:hypothetical protein
MPGPRFIVLPMPVAGMVFPNVPQNWNSFTVSGFNVAKGKRVDLTLLLKPEYFSRRGHSEHRDGNVVYSLRTL